MCSVCVRGRLPCVAGVRVVALGIANPSDMVCGNGLEYMAI